MKRRLVGKAVLGVTVPLGLTGLFFAMTLGAGAPEGGSQEGAAAIDPDAKRIDELVEEIARNMETIEKLLSERETGSPIQATQGKVSEEIEKLIELLSQCQQCSGGGGGSASMAQGSQGKESGSQKASAKQEEVGKEGSRTEPKGNQSVPNVRKADGPVPRSRVDGPLTGKDGIGRWGLLPGAELEQMFDLGREKLPARYLEILSRYYIRLSEAYEKKE